jgi:predicted HD superfamily hydrolase involved in NAD metabolism
VTASGVAASASVLFRLQGLVLPRTLAHSQFVSDHARALAGRWGLDAEAAALAGLLHDCAKNLPPEAYLSMAESAGFEIYAAERRSPKVLHQRLGALWARRDFAVRDLAVLQAIECHTTGRADMGPLARCLLVADYTSSDRDFPGVAPLRRALDRGLEPAFVAVLRFKRDYVAGKSLPEHPWARAAHARWL